MVNKSRVLGTPSSLRRVHRSLALREVFDSPGASRGELAERLGLSQMAIGRIVRELESSGLIREASQETSANGRGRPASVLTLRPEGAYVVGVVLSAYSQEVSLVDLQGEQIASAPIEIDDISDGERVIDVACDAIEKMVVTAGIDVLRVHGVGFGVAVNVDSERGLVLGDGYLGWRPFDLRSMVIERLGIPVTVERVADMLVRGETFHGAARDSRAVVMIHAATTLGMSVWFDNALLRGAGNRAGRLGHFPARPTGLICSCGRSNCLNCVASGWSVLARLGLIDDPHYAPSQVQRYAREINHLMVSRPGEEAHASRSPRYLGLAGTELARALSYIDLAFDPDVIIIAGSLARNDHYFRGVLRGLQKGDAQSSGIARKLTRGTMTPLRASGLVALLDHVLSASFEIDREKKRRALPRVRRMHDA